MRLRACLVSVGIAVLLLALGGLALPARADGTVGDGTPGSCTETEFLDELVGGGLVIFDCGPNPVTITLYVGNGIAPDPNTTIDGGMLGRIILSGDGSERLFALGFGDSLTLTNLVLTDGYANGPGGAINNYGGELVLDNVTIQNSEAEDTSYGGGALYNLYGAVTIRNSRFLNNDSAGGGAIYNDTPGAVTVIDSDFIGNVAHGLYGGAVTNLDEFSMTGGLFQGNVVTYTGSAPDPIGGGAIANDPFGTVLLDDVTLLDNQTGLQFDLQWVGGAVLNFGVMEITNSDVSGNQSVRGGGIYNYDTATLTNTQVTGNSADLGGGLFNEEGILSVWGGAFASNMATTHGGGLYTGWSLDSVMASISGTALRDNQAGENGGGLYVYKGRLDLNGASVEGNQAVEDGGGIYVYDAHLRATDSTIRANTTTNGDGGGIWIFTPVSLAGVTVAHNEAGRDGGGLMNTNGATSWITNTTISGNTAERYGGGLYNDGQLSLRHVTVADNSAASGGGLYNYNFAGVTAWLTNTIIANSPLGGNCFGNPLPARYSLDSDSTCALTAVPGTVNFSGVDPLLTALGDYGGPTWTHMLPTNSPARNAVVGSDAAPVDQRNKPRPVGAFDIGAVERQSNDSDLAVRALLPFLIR